MNTEKPRTPDAGQAAPKGNGHHALTERPKPMITNLKTVKTKATSKPMPPAKLPAPSEDPERVARNRELARTFIMPVVAILFAGLFWEIYSSREGVVLPGPLKTLHDSWNLIAHPWFDNGPNDKGLGWQLLYSLRRVAMGYSLAAVVGVVLGIVIGKSAMAFKALDPIFQVLRTIPPLAWLPISLATFNQANPSAIFVIFITAIWPILINTSVGIMRIPADYENVAKVYQLRGSRYFFKVMLPSAAPYIFTGLRISIGMAWLAIVAAEMLTGGVGIGFFIWDSWNSSRMSDIIVSVFYVGMIGLALDRIVAKIASLFGTKGD
ncbi:MAG TPA: nitrate ABC transporter permease [Fibrobacteria bacterium]|nr:nitrate ABC transporter permease [Fibrobacteria bacterium]